MHGHTVSRLRHDGRLADRLVRMCLIAGAGVASGLGDMNLAGRCGFGYEENGQADRLNEEQLSHR
jgi:hypothetical protein